MEGEPSLPRKVIVAILIAVSVAGTLLWEEMRFEVRDPIGQQTPEHSR
jgi:hypothetical protein